MKNFAGTSKELTTAAGNFPVVGGYENKFNELVISLLKLDLSIMRPSSLNVVKQLKDCDALVDIVLRGVTRELRTCSKQSSLSI